MNAIALPLCTLDTASLHSPLPPFHTQLLAPRTATSPPLLTLELSPPKGGDPSLLLERAKALEGWVHAINVPDCQRALLRMSALAAAVLVQQHTSLEAIWQLTCRDRNLIALQADLMGGHALGLRSVLALTGDPVQVGDQHSVAQQVFHLEAVQLLKLLSTLNAGYDATQSPLPKGPTTLLRGTALNPLRLHNSAQKKRLCHKLEAGVDFVQTQPVYELAPVEQLVDTLAWASEQVGCAPPAILLGLLPPKTAKAAVFLNKYVPGIAVPPAWVAALEQAEATHPDTLHTLSFEKTAQLAAQVHQQLGSQAIAGFHLMPVVLEAHALAWVQCLHQQLGGC